MILVGCSHVVEVNRIGMRSYQKSDDRPFLFLDVVVLALGDCKDRWATVLLPFLLLLLRLVLTIVRVVVDDERKT